MEIGHRIIFKPNLDTPCIGHPPEFIYVTSLGGEAHQFIVNRAPRLGLGVQLRKFRREVDLGKRGQREEAGGAQVGRP
jgi:hypothetical protein